MNYVEHLSSNVHISLYHLHNSFCTFQIFQEILPAKKNEAAQLYYKLPYPTCISDRKKSLNV